MQSDDAAQLTDMLEALCRLLLESKRKNKELAAENAALNEEATENAKLRSQAAEQSFLAATNIGLKKQENSALANENTATAHVISVLLLLSHVFSDHIFKSFVSAQSSLFFFFT